VVAVVAKPQSLGMRARVVMLSGEGDSLRAIAERLGVTQRTVCLWRRRYQDEGLKSRHRSGRPRRISRRKELAMVTATMRPPKHATHWSAQQQCGSRCAMSIFSLPGFRSKVRTSFEQSSGRKAEVCSP
jgi:transposase-like protein